MWVLHTEGGMKLVFRLDGIGFCIDVAALMEVKECLIDCLDRDKEDSRQGVLGQVPFRGDLIPLYDPRFTFEFVARPLPEQFKIMVLTVQQALFAVAVEEVEGIFPATQLQPVELPTLLREPDRQPYKGLELWQGEPLVSCGDECLRRMAERAP